MAIELDNSDVAIGNNVSSVTLSFACSGDDRVLIVGYFGGTESSITYNGDALTQVNTEAGVRAWRLIAPDTGTHDLVITLTGANYPKVTVANFTGVDQATPLDTYARATSWGTSGNVNVSSANGDTALCFSAGTGVQTLGANQTLIETANLYNSYNILSTKAGETTCNVSVTWPSNTTWYVVGISMNPAASTPLGHPTMKRWGGVPFVRLNKGVW